MAEGWLELNGPLALRGATSAVEACNTFTERFGLVLTPVQASELVLTRRDALKSCGRLELGGGMLPALIHAFCDSPYVNRENYAGTLCALTELFYTYKNETLDAVDDDKLVALMRDAFNGACAGSVELLEANVLAKLAKRLRFGVRELEPEGWEGDAQ